MSAPAAQASCLAALAPRAPLIAYITRPGQDYSEPMGSPDTNAACPAAVPLAFNLHGQGWRKGGRLSLMRDGQDAGAAARGGSCKQDHQPPSP